MTEEAAMRLVSEVNKLCQKIDAIRPMIAFMCCAIVLVFAITIANFMAKMRKQMTVDNSKPINARWKPTKDGNYCCTNCSAILRRDEFYYRRYLHCYYCGAKMEEDK